MASSLWGEHHGYVEGNQLLLDWASHSFLGAMGIKIGVVGAVAITLWRMGRRLPIIQRHVGLIFAAAAGASLIGPIQNLHAFVT